MKIIKRFFSEKSEKADTPEVESCSKESEEGNVELTLSIHPDESARMSELEKNQLEQELKECTPLRKNEINIAEIYAFRTDKGLEVSFFIRNGLERPVNFEDTPLSVINSKGEILAYQKFDLRPMGIIEKKSARPWKVNFKPENIFVSEVEYDDWQIIFDNRKITINREL